MKSLGLLGGTSWHSSKVYYHLFNELCNRRLGAKVNPPIILYNLDHSKIHPLQEADDWAAIANMYIEASKKMEAAGCQGLLFLANTPHKVYHEVSAAIDLPILHIADATATHLKAEGLSRPGLIGTKFTMSEDFISGRITAKCGAKVFVPSRDDQERLHMLIHQHLVTGDFSNAVAEEVMYIMDELHRIWQTDSVILGCTEFPVLLNNQYFPVPLLDTTRMHVEYALKFMQS